MRELNLTPLDLFKLISVVNAMPSQSHSDKRTFNLQDQIVSSVNGQKTPINKAFSKTIYKELRNRVISTPSAQKKYNSCFVNDILDWREIYSLPHRVTSDTKFREFQFKLLNRYLVTNDFLNKLKLVRCLPQHALFVEKKANPSNISLSLVIMPKISGQRLLSGSAI